MKTWGFIALIAIFVGAYFALERLASRSGENRVLDAFTFMTILIFAMIALAVVLWESFIKADFFEMPPIRYTRQFLQWLGVRQRQDLRLRMANPASFFIPAPSDDDNLRDFELEALIRSRQWNEAEQYIREKLDFYRTDLTQQHLVTGFHIYTHYFKVLMDLRLKHLGTDDKKWTADIERYAPGPPRQG